MATEVCEMEEKRRRGREKEGSGDMFVRLYFWLASCTSLE